MLKRGSEHAVFGIVAVVAILGAFLLVNQGISGFAVLAGGRESSKNIQVVESQADSLSAETKVLDETQQVGNADRAWAPYYLHAMRTMLEQTPDAFLKAISEELSITEQVYAERFTTNIFCQPRRGKPIITTIAHCDEIEGTIGEFGDGCIIGKQIEPIPQVEEPLRLWEIKDHETPFELRIEALLKESGIPQKEYIPHIHDCDDFAFRAWAYLYNAGIEADYTDYITRNGEQVGHAVVSAIDPGTRARSHFEPQTGETVTLPRRAVIAFESTNSERIIEEHKYETQRELEQYFRVFPLPRCVPTSTESCL